MDNYYNPYKKHKVKSKNKNNKKHNYKPNIKNYNFKCINYKDKCGKIIHKIKHNHYSKN